MARWIVTGVVFASFIVALLYAICGASRGDEHFPRWVVANMVIVGVGSVVCGLLAAWADGAL